MLSTVRRHSIRCTTALAVMFIGILGMGGCATLDEFAVRDFMDKPRPYTGIGPLVSCDSPVHVVFVHGMGGYVAGDPQTIVDEILLHNPDLQQVSTPRTTRIPQTGIKLGKMLETEYSADCSGGDGNRRVLRTFVIHWTNFNSPKTYVNWFDQQTKYTDHRLELHNRLKRRLLNKNVADAVLYAGTYRSKILDTVREGFEVIARNHPHSNAHNVVVAFSLGSIITFDVLEQMKRAPKKGIAEFASAFRANTAKFFILSNQIILLRLSDATLPATDPCRSGGSNTALPIDDAIKSYIKDRENRKIGPVRSAFDQEPWIVAFSDPNDILSYPIIPPCLSGKYQNDFLDVVTSVSRKALWVPGFGWVTNPEKAHIGYGGDKRIIKLIVKGYKP